MRSKSKPGTKRIVGLLLCLLRLAPYIAQELTLGEIGFDVAWIAVIAFGTRQSPGSPNTGLKFPLRLSTRTAVTPSDCKSRAFGGFGTGIRRIPVLHWRQFDSSGARIANATLVKSVPSRTVPDLSNPFSAHTVTGVRRYHRFGRPGAFGDGGRFWLVHRTGRESSLAVHRLYRAFSVESGISGRHRCHRRLQ